MDIVHWPKKKLIIWSSSTPDTVTEQPIRNISSSFFFLLPSLLPLNCYLHLSYWCLAYEIKVHLKDFECTGLKQRHDRRRKQTAKSGCTLLSAKEKKWRHHKSFFLHNLRQRRQYNFVKKGGHPCSLPYSKRLAGWLSTQHGQGMEALWEHRVIASVLQWWCFESQKGFQQTNFPLFAATLAPPQNIKRHNSI